MQILKPSISKRRRLFRFCVMITLLVFLSYWVWTRYTFVKAHLPYFKTQVERAKGILNDDINVFNKQINPGFNGLRLFMTTDELYRLVGKENTRSEPETEGYAGTPEIEIPELRVIIIERTMHSYNYLPSELDEYGVKLPALNWENGSWDKDNPWIKQLDDKTYKITQLQNFYCHFFKGVLYRINITYGFSWDNRDLRWRQFVEPTFLQYGLPVKCPDAVPDCTLAPLLVLNDGITKLSFLRDIQYGDKGDTYFVTYENNKIAKAVEEAKKAYFTGPKF